MLVADSQRIQPASSLEFYKQQYGRLMWLSEGYLAGESSNLTRRHSSFEYTTHRDFVDEDNEPALPSILKRTVSEDCSHPPGLVRTVSQIRKQLQFHEDVDVVYFDRLKEPTTNERKERAKLKDNTLSQYRITERTIHIACTLHKNDNRSCERDEIKCECPVIPNHIFQGKKAEIQTDLTGKHSWKLFIPVGDEFIRNRTSVKALSGGHKLIVLTYKDQRGEDGKLYAHQYIEKLHMPHAIDAYGVRASMDKDGNLKITAPFLADKFKTSWVLLLIDMMYIGAKSDMTMGVVISHVKLTFQFLDRNANIVVTKLRLIYLILHTVWDSLVVARVLLNKYLPVGYTVSFQTTYCYQNM